LFNKFIFQGDFKMRPIKILVVTIQYAPDRGPSAAIFTNLCEDLAQDGYDVTVVTGFPHYGRDSVWPEYSGKVYQDEELNRVHVLRSYVYASKTRLWQRLVYHASFNTLGTLNTLRADKPDVMIADGPAFWVGLPTLIRAIWLGVPFIYVVHDIYPDLAVRLGVITNSGLIKLADRVERFFYNRASYISVLAHGFKENLCQKGIPEHKIIIIPACTDTEFIRPLSGENKFRQQWGLDNKFIVLYTANIGLPQGLDNVLLAAKRLTYYPDIAIIMIGEGQAKPALQALAEEENLSNVYFFPLQPREDVPDVFDLADVALVSLRAEVILEAVPSKAYSIMSSGRPMIATVQSDTQIAYLIEQANCGIRVEPGDPKALAEAILELFLNEPLRTVMGRNGRAFVVENYSRKVAARKYQKLLQSLV
jgi:colanic acid biosynthesis glycosyl transferase WcaI